MDNTRLFHKTLMIIPYIFNHGSSVSESELKRLFGLKRVELRAIYDLTILLGYPPYYPNNFFDLYIDEDDPKKIQLWVPLRNLLTQPIGFNIKEAFALISGYRLVSRTLKNKKLDELIGKIELLLQKAINDDLSVIDHKIDFNVPFQNLDEKIKAVDSAIRNRKTIRLDYYSASKDEISEREIQPCLSVNHFGKWYLIGYCEQKKNYRSFRFDRIKTLLIEEKEFVPRDDFDPMKYIEAENFFFEEGEPAEFIKLRFRKRAAKNIKQEFFNAELKTLSSGDVLATMPLRNPEWILSSLRKFGSDVIVESPENFKTILISNYERLLKKYKT